MSAHFDEEKVTLTLHSKNNETMVADLEDEDDCIYTGYKIVGVRHNIPFISNPKKIPRYICKNSLVELVEKKRNL